jgi:hypothetical protein
MAKTKSISAPAVTPLKSARSGMTRAQMKKVLGDFHNRPAQISHEQMLQIEECVSSWGFSRRMMLGTLKLSGKELVAAIKNMDADLAETFAENAIAAKIYAGRMRNLAKLADTASVRLMLALSERADMDQLLKAAQTSRDAQEAAA